MNDIIHRRNVCRICNSKDFELVFSLNPSPIGDAYIQSDKLNIHQDSYPIDLFLCYNCGLAQIVDIIDPNILYGQYIYMTESSLGLMEHFQNYADDIIHRYRISDKSFIVDIGSNDGILLEAFQKRGMNVLGVEPAVHIANTANRNGIKTIPEFFTVGLANNIKRDYGQAKLITSNNVIANIDDLKSWIEAIDILLAQDGFYVFESFYLSDLIENMVFDFLYHEHLSAFSVKSIKYLFEQAGFELVAVERVSTKGGSLRYYVQRENGSLVKDNSVERLLKEEIDRGIHLKQTYIDFQERIQNLKSVTREFLLQEKMNGKSIAAFGASITGTTLMYHFEIGNLIDYFIDENSAKQGLFSPGLHIPVFSPDVIYERKPDCILILAWRFTAPIIHKNKKFIENGGRFVIPIPEFKIINQVQIDC